MNMMQEINIHDLLYKKFIIIDIFQSFEDFNGLNILDL